MGSGNLLQEKRGPPQMVFCMRRKNSPIIKRRSESILHQIGLKLRIQIRRFSGELCEGMGKIQRRFITEAIYGIQSRGSVSLSEIGRSLSENTSLKKRIDRLSRNLGRPGVTNVEN